MTLVVVAYGNRYGFTRGGREVSGRLDRVLSGADDRPMRDGRVQSPRERSADTRPGLRPVETFTEPRALVRHAGYAEERRLALGALDLTTVDPPIVDVVEAFRPLPYCFTLQCCHGHFLTTANQDEHSPTPLPEGYAGSVRYRIAYVAFCIDGDTRGRAFLERLSRVPRIEPAYVQFGSADWFWDQWPNSYVLQVEPAAHRFKDQAALTVGEALQTQRVRDRFFDELRQVLAEESARSPAGA